MRARVFISCGQNRQSDEVEVVEAVHRRVSALGFEAYYATADQALRGLKENIFARLAASEYFLFIDFKREGLVDSEYCRGSVFSHQELAIASFLELPVLAFQERGVEPFPGLLAYVQGNCIPFEDRERLPDRVAEEVESRGWSADWRNVLALRRDDPREHTRMSIGSGRTARFYHALVENQNRFRSARYCGVYPLRILELGSGEALEIRRTIELKWTGTDLTLVPIPPARAREVDVLVVLEEDPPQAFLATHTDSGSYMIPLRWPGAYRVEALVLNESFPEELRFAFGIRLGGSIDDVRVEVLGEEPGRADVIADPAAVEGL